MVQKIAQADEREWSIQLSQNLSPPKNQASIFFEGFLDINNIDLRYSNEYRAPRVVKEYIQEVWSHHISAFPNEHDGVLMGTHVDNCKLDKYNFVIPLHRTSYKEYVGTRDIDFSQKFPAHKRADPLGLCLVIKTSDNKYIFGKRSDSVNQGAGKLYFVGGYMSFTENENPITHNIRKELHEEIGIYHDKIVDIRLISLHYNNVHCHPELIFVINTNVNSTDVERHWSEAEDRKEIDSLYFVSKDNINSKYLMAISDTKLTWEVEYVASRVSDNIIAID